MDIQALLKDIKNLTEYQIDQRLEHLINTNPNFNNLNSSNKAVIMSLLQEYKSIIKRGYPVTEEKIREDNYNLYQKRLSLGLSQTDLDQIKKILEAFRA